MAELGRSFIMMECGCFKWLKEKRESPHLVVVVVFLALLLDNLLLTIVVPVIPDYLYESEFLNKTMAKTKLSSIPAPDSSSFLSRLLYYRYSELLYSEEHMNSTKGLLKEPCRKDTHFLREENVSVGLLIASKSMVHILVNPIVSLFTNRVGYGLPMFLGFVIMLISIFTFAFGGSYIFLLLARMLQGIGSSFIVVAGLGMVASIYTDDFQRGKAMGIALGGVVLGVVALQLFILTPKISPSAIAPPSFFSLLKDPYILVAAGSLCITSMGIGMLEPTLPIWMLGSMCSPDWQIGLVFLPTSISYLVCTNVFGIISHKFGRWLCSLLGMALLGICLLCMSLAVNIFGLIAPIAGIGISLGIVDSSIMPIMGYLVDLRHSSVYGGVYAISDIAISFGYAIGPSVAGAIAKAIGFPLLMVIIGLLNLIYSPLCVLLRNPPKKEERMALLNHDSIVNSWLMKKSQT
ncbi:chromaffin granule amine transporter isoform X2 [Xenopus laevis]|uniref:Chromaffin granule amine transporter isoform X2 n=1 Tax=Xenopus laevis TaxID=8355 RepID=A0A8J0UWE8_XENLA|nr:chromaffin granule amine transporter isoform X2 [Xenopus laevis]